MRTRLMISGVEVRLVPEDEPVHVHNAHLLPVGPASQAAFERATAIEVENVNPIVVRRVMPYTYEQRQDPLFEPEVEEIWLYMPHQIGDKLRLTYELWTECFKERDKARDEVARLKDRVTDLWERIEAMHNAPWWRRLLRRWI